MGGMNPLTVKFQVVFLKFSVFLLGHLPQKRSWDQAFGIPGRTSAPPLRTSVSGNNFQINQSWFKRFLSYPERRRILRGGSSERSLSRPPQLGQVL